MAENKKIAFLCHPYHRGGVTRWMADAAIAFAGEGWEVYFITVEPSVVFFSGKGRETLLQLLQKGKSSVKTISMRVGREFEFGTQAYRAFVYKKLLLNLPAGTPVILSDDPAVWEAACAMHDTYPVVGVLHADEPYYYSLAKQYFKSVSVLACVSERVKKTTIEQIPDIDVETIYTIPCGINLPAANPVVANGDILQLVYVGRVTEYQKRVSDLVKVCALLHENNKVFHLDIIGDGGDKTMLEHKFEDAGLSSLVTFHGWLSQKEVSECLGQSDILVLTSDFEGTPIAMMEALAAGCGLAGTRVSGIEDYELHPLANDCLGLFDVGAIEDAITKIEKIAGVPVHVRQQSARKLAEAEFSMQVCLEKYIKAIATINATHPKSAEKPEMPFSAIIYSRIIAVFRAMKVGLISK